MNAMTTIYAKQSFFEEAVDAGKDALKMFKKCGFKKGEAVSQNSLAKAFLAKGDAAAAIKAAKESLATFASLGDSPSVAAVYSTVSDAYLVMGDTFRAARTIGKACEVYSG